MTNINFLIRGEEVELPECVLKALNESKNRRLFVVYKQPSGSLSSREIDLTVYDLKLLQSIIAQNGWIDGVGEFAILSEKGIVYKSLGSDFTLKTDSAGYMYINGNEYVVHSHKDGFVGGYTKENVDFVYRRYLQLEFWTPDKRFSASGFTC